MKLTEIKDAKDMDELIDKIDRVIRQANAEIELLKKKIRALEDSRESEEET